MARIRWAELGGYAIAVAALVALISIGLAPGAPHVLSLVEASKIRQSLRKHHS